MSRSIFKSFLGAAILVAAGTFCQLSYGQNSWNHGFGPRNYGYSGNVYSQNYGGIGYSQGYVTGYTPYYNNYYPYGGYSPYVGYSGVSLGGFSSGAYTYYPAPVYYGSYNSAYYRGGPYRNYGYARRRAW